jgi:hypothetical protein
VWVRTRVARQHALEVAEKFRQSVLNEVGSTPFRFRTLILVVQPPRDRVMRVVHLDDKVSERKL